MSIDTVDRFKSLVSQKNGVARPNLFRVKLPSLPGASSEELNVLCRDVSLPGRQIMTNERTIGLKRTKVPYGFAVEDVSMTFLALNDYGVREYFETWQQLAVNQNTYEVGYQRGAGGYGRTVVIEQLRRVDKVPTALQKKNFNQNSLIPELSDFNAFNMFYDLGLGLSDIVVYKCELENAFPTTLNANLLNNDQNGLVEINVQLSYTNWHNKQFVSPTNVEQFLRNGVRTFIGSLF